MPEVIVFCETWDVDDLNLLFQGSLSHNGIVNVEVAGARYTTVKKTGHSKRTIILGNQNKQR